MSMAADPNAQINPKAGPQLPDSVMAMFSLKGKVACISGGGAGIGFAVAEAFAEAGADVAIWYNSNKKAVEKAEDLGKRFGVKAAAYQCGVTDYDEVNKIVQQVEKDFGRLDIFVANAGVGLGAGILDTEPKDWAKVVDTNFTGVFNCAKAAGLIFKKQGTGNLIITASMSGHIVNVPLDQGCYNATKAAVIHLGKSLAREWRDFARVNTVSPGYFNTDMGAAPAMLAEALRMSVMHRQGDVKELKGVYLYLASDASTFTTGTDIIVDGGYCLP
ncbi:hypothetical protein OC842_002830 [Tilletia horrida]|uniref:NADP-dependent mannitol dehydrogenase n=1 Tax=Tilletia horrida TaxID=155126 RepID=A0AAN6JKS6_9BASI|nr:hypothetical protein OC842_002830 [Tilletia horrida]KAK0562971.1 hypothetical protein OC844_002430 [Tilletia horrida]